MGLNKGRHMGSCEESFIQRKALFFCVAKFMPLARVVLDGSQL